ncbi:MAG: hypothetical protein J6N15_10105 [Ruminiclostridium sp.]|nr:hypothetical protein [Ruminiclostridium sp.]
MPITKANPTSAEFVKKAINTLFQDIAALSDSVIDTNTDLLCDGGMSVRDRTISLDTANYLLENLSVIMLGLISNDTFRESVKQAVAVEISLDEKNEEFVRSIRKDMGDKPIDRSKAKYIVIDLGVYKPKIAEKIGNMVSESLEKIMTFQDDFNQLCDELTKEDAIDIGFCVANYAYLIRAFAHNAVFMDYIRDVIKAVREELKIN